MAFSVTKTECSKMRLCVDMCCRGRDLAIRRLFTQVCLDSEKDDRYSGIGLKNLLETHFQSVFCLWKWIKKSVHAVDFSICGIIPPCDM